MLEGWHDFYILLGTASAALVALLFVAASIGTGLISSQRSTATRTFMSPIIFHYTCVLFVSLVALVPQLPDLWFAVIIGALGLVGGIYCIGITAGVVRSSAADGADRLGYGAGPLIAYAAVLAAAILLNAGFSIAPKLLAAALIVLLLVNIRNAWDLTITFVRRHGDQRPQS